MHCPLNYPVKVSHVQETTFDDVTGMGNRVLGFRMLEALLEKFQICAIFNNIYTSDIYKQILFYILHLNLLR